MFGNPTLCKPEDIFPAHVLRPADYLRIGRGQAGLRNLEFETNTMGCLIPKNHKPDEKGYVRIKRMRFNGERGKEYLHRIAYLFYHGLEKIPDGYEVDHRCLNSVCANPRHLWLLPKDQHHFLSSRSAHVMEKERFRLLWLAYDRSIPVAVVEEHSERSFPTLRKWLREFEAEEAEDRERWTQMGQASV